MQDGNLSKNGMQMCGMYAIQKAENSDKNFLGSIQIRTGGKWRPLINITR